MNALKFVLSVIGGAVVAFYVGAMFGFFPFFANNLMIRAVGFSTVIICAVIAICTCIIVKKIEKGNNE